MSINDLTVGEARELARLFGSVSNSADDSHWKIGENYIIRTVTMIDVGRLEKVTPNELVLSSAAWIADTGRYSDAIKSGVLNEVEPYADNPVIVGRGAIIDATIWMHKIPREQK